MTTTRLTPNAARSEHHGFVQLIDGKTGRVLQQREGAAAQISYYRANVWHVAEGHDVIHVVASEFCQPLKFFSPVSIGTLVHVYDCDGLPSNAGDKPLWSGPVEEFETVRVERNLESLGFSVFSAAGEWLATSEF